VSDPDEMVVCRVSPRVRALNDRNPGEEVILSRAAAYEHQRRGRVLVLGPLVPTTKSDEEE